jgi:hypothetical protein
MKLRLDRCSMSRGPDEASVEVAEISGTWANSSALPSGMIAVAWALEPSKIVGYRDGFR